MAHAWANQPNYFTFSMQQEFHVGTKEEEATSLCLPVTVRSLLYFCLCTYSLPSPIETERLCSACWELGCPFWDGEPQSKSKEKWEELWITVFFSTTMPTLLGLRTTFLCGPSGKEEEIAKAVVRAEVVNLSQLRPLGPPRVVHRNYSS